MPVTDVKNSAPEGARFQARVMQGAAQGLFSQLLRHFDPDVVGLAPGRDVVIFLGRHRQMPTLHCNVAMQSFQHLWITEAIAPIFLELLQ